MKNKGIIICLSLFLIAIMSVIVVKSTPAEAEGYSIKVDEFFLKIKAGEIDEAVDFIYGDNPWISLAADNVRQLKSQMANTVSLVGEYHGHELLTEKVVAGRFAYLKYFVIYDRQPLSFIFEFYKPKDKWMTFGFLFDAKIDDEIEETAKTAFYYDLFSEK